jgi:hypothetical protein
LHRTISFLEIRQEYIRVRQIGQQGRCLLALPHLRMGVDETNEQVYLASAASSETKV